MDWMDCMLVIGTWVMAGGTLVMAYFICKQYKQTQQQFEHMRKQSEKPVILDLIRYVISPFLHDLREIEEMPRDVWPSFKPLGSLQGGTTATEQSWLSTSSKRSFQMLGEKWRDTLTSATLRRSS